MTLFKILKFQVFSQVKFFPKPFYCLPLIFPYFATNKLEFQKAQRITPFTIFKTLRFLSLRYSADFGRSRLVSQHRVPNSSLPVSSILHILGTIIFAIRLSCPFLCVVLSIRVIFPRWSVERTPLVETRTRCTINTIILFYTTFTIAELLSLKPVTKTSETGFDKKFQKLGPLWTSRIKSTRSVFYH